MKIVEMNEGAKITHELKGTLLLLDGGALCMDLARYQRDHAVTLDIMADGSGNLVMGQPGQLYVAQVEIPAKEYEEIKAEEIQTLEETAAENESDKNSTAVELRPLPFDMDNTVLRLWAVV